MHVINSFFYMQNVIFSEILYVLLLLLVTMRPEISYFSHDLTVTLNDMVNLYLIIIYHFLLLSVGIAIFWNTVMDDLLIIKNNDYNVETHCLYRLPAACCKCIETIWQLIELKRCDVFYKRYILEKKIIVGNMHRYV